MTIQLDDAPLPLPCAGRDLPMDAMRSRALEFLTETSARFPDIFSYTTGGWSVVVANHPAYIRDVLFEQRANYTKLGTPDLMMLKPMLGEGLMTTDGEVWAEQRRMLQPAFHHRPMQGFARHMVAITRRMLDAWEAHAGSGAMFDLEDELNALTLQIVARCLFGLDLDSDGSGFGRAVWTMNEYMSHFDPTDVDRMRAFQQAIRTIHSVVQRILESRRGDPAAHDDMLAMMLAARREGSGAALTQKQISDQIFTFLMAGHETTAKALTWTLYLLARHPAALERAQADSDGFPVDAEDPEEAVSRLDYGWMVLQESLRLYPPAWIVSRMACTDHRLGPYPIPAGTLVIVCPYLIHRHPGFWSDPETFDPERFGPGRAAAQPQYSYIPFGGGPRACIGQPFARLETRLVLAMILGRFKVHLVPGQTVVPDALVTLRPRDGIRVRIERR